MEDALEFLSSNDEVTVSPQCMDDACLEAMVQAFEGFEFSPAQNEPTVGFIIYPGAQVDPRAYAPIAHEIAGNGILSIIVPMPGLFALNGWERATDMIEAHPEIESWYLAGHSMGGAMTAHFAKENPGIMRGLVLWAAYAGGGDDLSESDETVVSIYGNLDGVATVDEIEEGKPILPADTRYVEIRGGNHAGFGMYGDQDGDYAADIPIALQHHQVVGATTHFIRTTEMEATIRELLEEYVKVSHSTRARAVLDHPEGISAALCLVQPLNAIDAGELETGRTPAVTLPPSELTSPPPAAPLTG